LQGLSFAPLPLTQDVVSLGESLYGDGVRNRLEVIDASAHGMTLQNKSSYKHIFSSSFS